MKYIILLRGINISGKNKISMVELKSKLITNNYKNVITYLNSGNVILESEYDTSYIKKDVNDIICKDFNLNIPVFVIKYDDLKDIYSNLPEFSLNNIDFYNNIIFILGDINPIDIINEIGKPIDDIDTIQEYKTIIYWSYDLKKYQKSIWWKKTTSSQIKDMITIRTVNTIKKIIELCER